ncbi:hypothetical protein A2U01_0107780, partial [Trifolium medium]|nr:hypothetical protein [Trifolium medium]
MDKINKLVRRVRGSSFSTRRDREAARQAEPEPEPVIDEDEALDLEPDDDE